MNKTTLGTKEKYEVEARCMACQFKAFERLMDKFQISYTDRQNFFRFYNLTMARSAALTMPEIFRELNNEFCKITGIADPYAEEKKKSNDISLQLYNGLRKEVIDSPHPFGMALRLSIAGNSMDYGAGSEFNIHDTIQKVLNSKFAIDHSLELEKRIKTAKKILYIGDNAGEIVFDKLFIEMMMHNHLTYAVRDSAVLNDVTQEDAHQVGMDLVADVISNGNNFPSTILSQCSPEFLRLYNEADLIISKGQGNLEGLINENDPRIFFLLMVKCDVVAEMLGVEKDSFVIYNN